MSTSIIAELLKWELQKMPCPLAKNTNIHYPVSAAKRRVFSESFIVLATLRWYSIMSLLLISGKNTSTDGNGKIISIGFSVQSPLSWSLIQETISDVQFSPHVQKERLELRCFVSAVHACHSKLRQCSWHTPESQSWRTKQPVFWKTPVWNVDMTM